MAGSVNKVILIGNLGQGPRGAAAQFRRPGGQLPLATSETWRDKASGERKERTEWHNVVIFNENLGKIAEQYCKKGTKVYLEGQLQTRKWQDQSGQDRYTTEVVLQRFRGELTLLDCAAAAPTATAFPTRAAPPAASGAPRAAASDRRPALSGGGRRRGGAADRRRHPVLTTSRSNAVTRRPRTLARLAVASAGSAAPPAHRGGHR